LEQLVLLVQLDLTDLLDCRDQTGNRARKALRDHKEPPALKAILELQGFLADLESRDPVVRKDLRAQLDLLVVQDQVGQRETQEGLVFQA